MCNCNNKVDINIDNKYIPTSCEILDIIKHTDIEWTFRVQTDTTGVKPGQFYEISMPKHGESPISVSGIGPDYVDFTIRNVGKVTSEIFKFVAGDRLLIRGPYGNGFDIEKYKGRDLLVVAGGSALAPVRGIIQYAYDHLEEFKSFKLIVGFKSPADVLFKVDLEKWSSKLDVVLTVDSAPEGYTGPMGLVTKYIAELSYEDVATLSAVIVGPPMMMKFSVMEVQKLGVTDRNIWVSYERKMNCGLGKCGHCRMDTVYVCTDGPVFNYAFAKNIAD